MPLAAGRGSAAMESSSQGILFADVRQWRSAEPDAPPAVPADGERQPRVQWINRNQLVLRTVDVEQLVGPDHSARAMWVLRPVPTRSVAARPSSACWGKRGNGSKSWKMATRKRSADAVSRRGNGGRASSWSG